MAINITPQKWQLILILPPVTFCFLYCIYAMKNSMTSMYNADV